jgi:hypothetical protein
MTRTFITTAEQDAALAWKATQAGVTEAAIIAEFAAKALADTVKAYLDSEGARVYELFKKASAAQQAEVIATLDASVTPKKIKRGK